MISCRCRPTRGEPHCPRSLGLAAEADAVRRRRTGGSARLPGLNAASDGAAARRFGDYGLAASAHRRRGVGNKSRATRAIPTLGPKLAQNLLHRLVPGAGPVDRRTTAPVTSSGLRPPTRSSPEPTVRALRRARLITLTRLLSRWHTPSVSPQRKMALSRYGIRYSAASYPRRVVRVAAVA
jgi:hypothetical protein